MNPGDWMWSTEHHEICRVVDAQTLWGETLYRVWLPTQDVVIRVRADQLKSLDTRHSSLTTHHLSHIAAAARVADTLTQNVLLAPIKEQVAEYNRGRFEDLIAAGWDLVIVDEAHRLGGSTDQIARYKLGQGLAEAAPYLLLLTATPHQGKTEAFYRLISLLDPLAFPDSASVTRERVQPYVIRTEKCRAREREKGEYAFAVRQRAVERIGLSAVRAHRLAQLAQEERAWREQLDKRAQVSPEMVPLIILRVMSGED